MMRSWTVNYILSTIGNETIKHFLPGLPSLRIRLGLVEASRPNLISGNHESHKIFRRRELARYKNPIKSVCLNNRIDIK